MSKWLVVNIGCIECGVSSQVVGLFDAHEEAVEVAARLLESHGWREGGQNDFCVFQLPDAPNELHSDYAEPPK
jgi:hypothetical protein